MLNVDLGIPNDKKQSFFKHPFLIGRDFMEDSNYLSQEQCDVFEKIRGVPC